jgi:PadR family transcriptional regulator PadR
MEPVADQVLDGLLEGLVLHAVEREPNHGYGIIKDLEAAIGEEPSKNRVYRVLRDLEEAGCVESREVTEDSRTRQVYSLTEEGARRLESYRELPGPFKNWLTGLFGDDGGSARASEAREPDQPVEAERGGVADRLAELPSGPPVRAPHAEFSLERAPGESRWRLVVERHAPDDYEGAEECPLTFVYLAIHRLLYET